jgi:hypothetical protein
MLARAIATDWGKYGIRIDAGYNVSELGIASI